MERTKVEKYANIGGINQKASTYQTGENEALSLVNVDFQEPGAYTSRWGFSLGIALQNIDTIFQVKEKGNTLGEGFSTSIGSFVVGNGNIFGVSLLFGSMTTLGVSFYQTLVSGRIYSFGFNNYTYDSTQFVDYNDFIYFASNTSGLKKAYKGTNKTEEVFSFGLPPKPNNQGLVIHSSALSGQTYLDGGTYVYAFGYYDIFSGFGFDKFFGPVDTLTPFLSGPQIVSCLPSAVTQWSLYPSFDTNCGPTFGFGAKGIAVYRSNVVGFPINQLVFRGIITYYSGTTMVFNDTVANDNNWQLAPPYIPLSNTATSQGGPEGEWVGDPLCSPNMLAIYENMLFAAGSSNFPNKLYYSQTDDPQTLSTLNFIEIPADGNPITALYTFNGGLLIFCRKYIYRLTGTGPDSFNLLEITRDYGCIGPRAVISFMNRVWFVDYKQIVEFNGITFTTVVGEKINQTLRSMDWSNINFKFVNAFYFKQRNEVWFAFPEYSLIIVFDHLTNGWTTFKGPQAKCMNSMFIAQGSTLVGVSNYNPVIYFGGASYAYYFDPSFTKDNGQGFTCQIKGKFHEDIAISDTKIFRRLFVDGPNSGISLGVCVNLYINHATNTIAYGTSIAIGCTFQARLDFGVVAKSVAVEFIHVTVNSRFKLFGYCLESRLMRLT